MLAIGRLSILAYPALSGDNESDVVSSLNCRTGWSGTLQALEHMLTTLGPLSHVNYHAPCWHEKILRL